MIILNTASKVLQVILGGAVATNELSCEASYIEKTAGIGDVPQSNSLLSNGGTAIALVAAPGGNILSVQVKSIAIQNRDTAAATVTVRVEDGSNARPLCVETLQAGDQLLYEDGGGWQTVDSSGNIKTIGPTPGRLLRAPQVLTLGTSYTPPSGCNGIDVELIGAGAGGGGASSTSSEASAGGGGAAGSYARKYFANPGSSALTYAIGAAGAAGVAAAGTGGTGGDTTFAVGVTTVTAKGGLGGVGQAHGTTLAAVLGGAGVVATSGDVNGCGAPGEHGTRLSGTVAVSGNGGSTRVGSGGTSRITEGVGNDGVGYGAGGGGAVSLGASDRAGGAGTAGLIVIREYA